jgi:hypothetical protein
MESNPMEIKLFRSPQIMSPAPPSEIFDHFHVELDAGPKPLFRGGERITGNVKIQLKKEVVIQVIRIQFKGRAVQKDKKGRENEKVSKTLH